MKILLMHLQGFLLSVCVLSLQQTSTYAAPKHYVIYLGSHHVEPRLSASPESITNTHHEMLSSVLKSGSKSSERLIYSYNKIYNGFAATLHEDEADELAKHPSVMAILESGMLEMTTTRSAEFLGLYKYPEKTPNHEGSIWEKASMGEDMILANIDTGVWPESKSFSDDEGYGPIPKKFKGTCANENDPTFKCNRKLIGSRYFAGAIQNLRKLNCTFNNTLTPRDGIYGHGTHTLSTAGGNFVGGTSWDGLGNGTAKGMAPRARLVAYKSLWEHPACDDFPANAGSAIDTLAAIEAAIDDNVDVINYSQTSDANSMIGSFHALKNGILVVSGAGNTGPAPATVSNPPWELTVAASTMDREFTAHIILANNVNIKGIRTYDLNLTSPVKMYPLITGAQARNASANVSEASLCKDGTLDAAKVTRKILVCRNEGVTETEISLTARDAGAVGLIFANVEELGDGITTPQIHALNTILTSYKDGETLFAYINSTKNPSASMSQPTSSLGIKPSPIMGPFSSRGPNKYNLGILKPDVTAPGVEILAAATPGKMNYPYVLKSGTSMSTPHVAGIALLLKKLHPDWDASAIKSAIMTTSSPLGNDGKPILDHDKVTPATPLAYGSGHIQPNLAMDPGLVYDMDQYDYLNFMCSITPDKKEMQVFTNNRSYNCPPSFNILDFNYPSIVVPDFNGNAIVTRKLKNVAEPSTYTPRIDAPAGVTIVVEPKTLVFSKKDQIIQFKLIFNADIKHLPKQYLFGSLVWSDAKHVVRSPIVVKPIF